MQVFEPLTPHPLKLIVVDSLQTMIDLMAGRPGPCQSPRCMTQFPSDISKWQGISLPRICPSCIVRAVHGILSERRHVAVWGSFSVDWEQEATNGLVASDF